MNSYADPEPAKAGFFVISQLSKRKTSVRTEVSYTIRDSNPRHPD